MFVFFWIFESSSFSFVMWSSMFFSNHSARFSFVVRLAHHIFCPQSAAMRLFLAMSFRKTYFFFLSFRFYFCCASRFRRVVKVLLLKTFLRRQHLCDGVFYSFFAQILCSCMCHNLISYFGWKTCFCAFHQNARQNTLSQGLSSLQNF